MNIIRDSDEESIELYCQDTKATFRISIMNKCRNAAFLSCLAVNENDRKNGFGTKALRDAEDIAHENGCNVISLQVKSNSWMEWWYEKHGYIQVGDGYYENMTLMSKRL